MSTSGVIARYRDLLDLPHKHLPVTLNEGDTPLIPLPRLGAELGCQLFAKFEGLNPTGSFKDRGMTTAISMAAKVGARAVIPTPTARPIAAVTHRLAAVVNPCTLSR